MFITFIITDSTGVKNKLIFISIQSFSIMTGIFPNCTSSKYFSRLSFSERNRTTATFHVQCLEFNSILLDLIRRL